jgi:hypothetical protein
VAMVESLESRVSLDFLTKPPEIQVPYPLGTTPWPKYGLTSGTGSVGLGVVVPVPNPETGEPRSNMAALAAITGVGSV